MPASCSHGRTLVYAFPSVRSRSFAARPRTSSAEVEEVATEQTAEESILVDGFCGCRLRQRRRYHCDSACILMIGLRLSHEGHEGVLDGADGCHGDLCQRLTPLSEMEAEAEAEAEEY